MSAGNDGQFHGARQRQSDLVDIGFANVRIENPLQHHRHRTCQLERQVYVGVQSDPVQHGLVP